LRASSLCGVRRASHPLLESLLEIGRHPDRPQPEYRMHAFIRPRHHKSWARQERGKEPLHEIGGKERRVSSHRNDVVLSRPVLRELSKPRLHAWEQTGVVRHAVGNDRKAQARKSRGLAIGIEDEVPDLGLEALNSVGEKRLAGSCRSRPSALIYRRRERCRRHARASPFS
jgi:hypothetical protein